MTKSLENERTQRKAGKDIKILNVKKSLESRELLKLLSPF